MGKALVLFLKLLWGSIVKAVSDLYQISKYIINFILMVLISCGISLFVPLDAFQVGILLMIFWFLNLYNR
jgi:hypothetical protein